MIKKNGRNEKEKEGRCLREVGMPPTNTRRGVSGVQPTLLTTPIGVMCEESAQKG